MGHPALSHTAVFRYHVPMLKMIDPARALEIVLEQSKPNKPGRIPVEHCIGLVLAEEICADRDYPPFNRASMDGYAVRLADAGGVVPIIGSIVAGQEPPTTPLTDGWAWEIMTGAACPPGTEAVVQYEITERRGNKVQLPAEFKKGKNIAVSGSECAKGSIVLKPGQQLTPIAAANLAAFGISVVSVHPMPTIAVISTGAELAIADNKPGPAQIRDSNGPMLQALAKTANVPIQSIVTAGDSREELQAALEFTAGADVVVLTGGVSMGTHDLVPEALAEFGVEIIFHKVTQKPGKPLLFGVKDDVLFFGLPGNPLAVHLGFHRYVEPAIRSIACLPYSRIRRIGTLAGEIRVGGNRTIYQLVKVKHQGEETYLLPLIGRGSADIFASAGANAYIEMLPECRELKSGDSVEYEIIGDDRWLI